MDIRNVFDGDATELAQRFVVALALVYLVTFAIGYVLVQFGESLPLLVGVVLASLVVLGFYRYYGH